MTGMAFSDQGFGAVSPVALLRALAALRRSVALYPAGHTIIDGAVKELDRLVDLACGDGERVRIELVDSTAFLEGYPYRLESRANADALEELTKLGVQCLEIERGVTREELIELARLLDELGDRPADRQAIGPLLHERGVERASLSKLVPIEVRNPAHEWPEEPAYVASAAYSKILDAARETVGSIFDGAAPDARSLGQLIADLGSIVDDGTALGQILAVKRYENHTFAHSVNVATLALHLGRRLELDEANLAVLGEAALLHDVGKRNIPVEILKKPSALNKREWRIMQRHPVLGAEILAQSEGLAALTPTVALEHHRNFDPGGYPDLGDQTPHFLSQIVAVVDTYEALTGARPYRDPLVPEEACLIVARMAGEKLNPALVRAFVSLISFFPLGSVVRTSKDEVGAVVATSEREPLHPVIELMEPDALGERRRIDTSERDEAGDYVRHITETLPHSAAEHSKRDLAATA